MYKLSAAAHASGVSATNLAAWTDRGIIELRGEDVDTSGSGTPRLYSRNRIIQVAIANSLTKVGLNILRAADAAAVFANENQAGRERGELFATGRTMLVVTALETKVVNSDRALGDYGPAVVIDVGKVVERVDAALGQVRRARAA
jgi:DNA-binding transcriptional MerR regulator